MATLETSTGGAHRTKLAIHPARAHSSVQEREAQEVKHLRQSLLFKAKPAPAHNRPVFEPNYQLAKPVTRPRPFVLATNIRAGTGKTGLETQQSNESSLGRGTINMSDEDFDLDDEDLDDGSGCSDLEEVCRIQSTQRTVECLAP